MSNRKNDAPTFRCAIYTRKATDEVLDPEFNSLDAQREAAEAYITRQSGRGWTCLPDHYDEPLLSAYQTIGTRPIRTR